ncbi:Cu2+-exporting ATPase [Roseiarcus fermentans]|uniref:Cu2+-exporting ATPase n=1 Tax=Roseiarcus fermentans TaxID=1473586 RepID=A0A366EMC3_9HYPH|nr:heavy metal translocating P-type ATPase [Roseiarcus fermentans]RBP03538.1 Cu2+-exporting ATPase [Roseiarcus fermentans]
MTEAQDLSLFIRHPAEGVAAMDLVVNGVYCGACIVAIEKGLGRQAGVRGARVNLANKRVTVEWDEGALEPPVILERLEALGYAAFPFTADAADSAERLEEKRLLRCLGVAAFGAMNVMLLSVSLWAGAENDPNAATRDLFHWLSALVALPCAAYAGMPFFDSAARSIRAGALNMDVPISLGVILALAMSMLQTVTHQHGSYFEGAVMLLMFLLAGRLLDQRMRRRTRDFAINLGAMRADRALKLGDDGEARETPIAAIRPGDLVLARPGERIAVDGAVEDGRSEVDQSLVTGETAPLTVAPGARVYAGTLNLTGALRIRVETAGSGTFLDEVNGLLAGAVEQRSSYVRLADRAARLYVPVVHVAALATFAAWLLLGAGWQPALTIAITVLIITCPCALGLAVPAVQVVAAGALFRRGLILHSGEALERLADVDCVVFDKTGTLTEPRPVLANAADIAPADLALAGRLALASRHPLARAIAEAAGARAPVAAEEFPGEGVQALDPAAPARLGSVAWIAAEREAAPVAARWPDASLIALGLPGRAVVFAVRQALRSDAAEVVAALRRGGREIEILSGDREPAVALAARELGVARYRAGLKPADKIARLRALKDAGRRTLMVGDGLNDAPALAAAHVSISPISAAHVAQAQADALFLGERLAPVADALRIAARARRLMVQNLWISAIYNVIAVPLAVLGFVTPLIAALAMSGSSVVVTLNALRARDAGRRTP